jgi:hypothetical protein
MSIMFVAIFGGSELASFGIVAKDPSNVVLAGVLGGVLPTFPHPPR